MNVYTDFIRYVIAYRYRYHRYAIAIVAIAIAYYITRVAFWSSITSSEVARR